MRLMIELHPAPFNTDELLDVQLQHKGCKYGYTAVCQAEVYESVLDVMFDHALESGKRAFKEAMKEKK